MLETLWDSLWNFRGLAGTILDFPVGLFGTFWESLGLSVVVSRTLWDCLGLSGTLCGTLWDVLGLSGMFFD